MSIEGQFNFFTICFTCFVCFVLYKAKISDERLQDHWSSGNWNLFLFAGNLISWPSKAHNMKKKQENIW